MRSPAAGVARRYQAWKTREFPIPAVWDADKRTRVVIHLRKTVIGQTFWILALTVFCLWLALSLGMSNGRLKTETRTTRKLAEQNSALIQDMKASTKVTRLQAFHSCERSKEIGPYLARDYARRRREQPPVQRDYDRTIPKAC